MDVMKGKPVFLKDKIEDYMVFVDNDIVRNDYYYVTDEMIEGLWEECKEKQDKLKLIDVLNMIAKGELKEGTKVIRGEETYIWNNKDCFFYDEEDNFICLDPMKCLNDEVELIEPPCEHEWREWSLGNRFQVTHYRKCEKCGLEEETEYNHFADVGKMEKIEELEKDDVLCLTDYQAISKMIDKLNEVIRKINKE